MRIATAFACAALVAGTCGPATLPAAELNILTLLELG
jgi:hypothetical protein